MNKLLLVAFGVLAVLAVIESANVEIFQLKASAINGKWSEFKTKFTKRYRNQTDETKKKTAFEKNLEFINTNNEKFNRGEVSQTFGINQFTDMVLYVHLYPFKIKFE